MVEYQTVDAGERPQTWHVRLNVDSMGAVKRVAPQKPRRRGRSRELGGLERAGPEDLGHLEELRVFNNLLGQLRRDSLRQPKDDFSEQCDPIRLGKRRDLHAEVAT